MNRLTVAAALLALAVLMWPRRQRVGVSGIRRAVTARTQGQAGGRLEWLGWLGWLGPWRRPGGSRGRGGPRARRRGGGEVAEILTLLDALAPAL
ncbi:MAG: hypothetical protein ABIW80_10940, partial [Lapillicoccus sp.]